MFGFKPLSEDEHLMKLKQTAMKLKQTADSLEKVTDSLEKTVEKLINKKNDNNRKRT
jgi:Na+/phosphate symporter